MPNGTRRCACARARAPPLTVRAWRRARVAQPVRPQVKLLKTLATDARLGPAIQQMLDEDTEWENFKAQEHDLFLAPEAERGLLTQQGSARMGLLSLDADRGWPRRVGKHG